MIKFSAPHAKAWTSSCLCVSNQQMFNKVCLDVKIIRAKLASSSHYHDSCQIDRVNPFALVRIHLFQRIMKGFFGSESQASIEVTNKGLQFFCFRSLVDLNI
jgi:hypothetical protein